MRRLIVLIVFVVALLAIVLRLALSAPPAIDLASPVTMIGQATPVSVHVRDSHGVRHATAVVQQNGVAHPVWEAPQPLPVKDATWSFTAGLNAVPQLQEGKAQLIIEAVSNGLFRKKSRLVSDVTVVTRPPTVSVDSEEHYLYLGMAELATFNVSGSFTEAGIRVGDQTFRAWPMPGGKPGFFSLFAFAWNMPASTVPVVYAANGAGANVTSPLVFQFPKKEQPKYTVHELQISDQFLQKVVGELDPNGTGDPVARFVKINNEMRKANNKTLSDLRLKTADKFLWSQPFARQSHRRRKPPSPTCATISTRETRSISKSISDMTLLPRSMSALRPQTMDAWFMPRRLASTATASLSTTATDCRPFTVTSARSRCAKATWSSKARSMGTSGQTGMAGGDHIHFAMQLDGVQIDPKEWWDPHWIKDHIAKRVDLPGFNYSAPAPVKASHKHHSRH